MHLSEVSHDFSESVEPTIKLPEASWTDVVARLAMRGVALGRRPAPPTPTAAPPARGATGSRGQSFPAARSPATESEKVT